MSDHAARRAAQPGGPGDSSRRKTAGARRAAWAWPAVLGLLLSSCASEPPAPPPVTPEDIVAAQSAEELEALRGKLEVELASPSLTPEEKAQYEVMQGQAGEKLAALHAEEVRRELAASESRVGDALNRQVIEDARKRLAPMEDWSPDAHRAMQAELDEEIARTDAAIARREASLAETDEADVAGRIQLLDEMAALEPAGSAAVLAYAARRDALLADLGREAAAAIEAEDYAEARRLLETARDLDPEDQGTAEQLATVDTREFERGFWKALEDGDPDAAYALLASVAATESFELIRPNLAGSADVMANYYVTLGAEATKAGDVPGAWQRFGQAREIRELLGDGTTRPPKEEKAFAELLLKLHERSMKKDQVGLGWGYLNVVHHLQGDSPALRRKLRETQEKVLQRAIKRVSVSHFETPETTESEFGDAVASGIVQHLFEAIPNDVRMIEREQLQDVMREKSLQAGKGDQGSGLAAADYLIQGTILEAKVDSIEKKGKKTMRVVTETGTGPNPEYQAWLELSSKERKKIPQPPQTAEIERKEDVTIEMTVHRKVGIFSVSYRVIDAETAKVIFADSVREKAQHEDTSSEGVELGDFKMEFKLASLPSDIEILSQLAEQSSEKIGARLVEVLAEPERTYRENAERFTREANYPGAAEQYAYAIVLAQRKGLATEDLELALRESTIAAAGG